MNLLKIAVISILILSTVDAQQPLDAAAVIENTKAATVIVLSGQGAGRLQSVATGLIVAGDGVLLTALHAVKGATEVQVRLPNGEVFDRVELIGSDERRDVAALRISARGLPALKVSTGPVAQGDGVIAVTNIGGLTWSATQGIVSATRQADEVPGAGTGYRLIQFDAAVAHGSSGGALVNRAGELVGVITRGSTGAGFAVPIESVLGLRDSTQKLALGSGSALKMPVTAATQVAQSQAALAGFDPKKALLDAKMVYIHSRTAFLTVATLNKALAANKDWVKLGLTIVQDQRLSDVQIELDRPLFTYEHTFVIADRKTTAVLGSGKVTAISGSVASKGLAKDITKFFTDAAGTTKK